MTAASLRSFRTPAAFRSWLEKNHARRTELVVRLFEALCWGWIDGIRRGVDKDSFSTRFTPRKKRSIWSRGQVNGSGAIGRRPYLGVTHPRSES